MHKYAIHLSGNVDNKGSCQKSSSRASFGSWDQALVREMKTLPFIPSPQVDPLV
jgi:hypothetical protein